MMTCRTSTSTDSRRYTVIVGAFFDAWGRLPALALFFNEGRTGNDAMRVDRDTDQARSGEAVLLKYFYCNATMVYLSSSIAMRLYCLNMSTTGCMAD